MTVRSSGNASTSWWRESSEAFPLLTRSWTRAIRSRVRAMVKARSTPKRKVVMLARATSTLMSPLDEPMSREDPATSTPLATAGQTAVSPRMAEAAADRRGPITRAT